MKDFLYRLLLHWGSTYEWARWRIWQDAQLSQRDRAAGCVI